MQADVLWSVTPYRCKLQWLIIAADVMKTIIFSLVFFFLISLNAPLYAERSVISKSQAVAIATQNYSGRVLAVKLKVDVYQIKILSENGKVRVIKVDAVNGRIKSGLKSR